MDLQKELEKQEKKIAQTRKTLQGYEAKMKAPNYEERVPEDVRAMNLEKASGLRKELDAITTIMGSLRAAAK